MNDEERAIRLALWARLLLAFGQEASDERLTLLVDLTARIPWLIPPLRHDPDPSAEPELLFARALDAAAMRAKGMWPPGPGDVLEAAVAIGGTLPSEGHGESTRRWVHEARKGIRGEPVLGLPSGQLAAISGGTRAIVAGVESAMTKGTT